ncbi:MAG: hypothetical protein AB8G15_16395 [Saprospiraceae bacterium]
MNNTIGLVVIGTILVAIISAFILSPQFRKDVIASEGEAALFGMINVKGVMIVLLTAIFGGIFAYIIKLDSEAQPQVTKQTKYFLNKNGFNTYKITNQHGEFLGEAEIPLDSTPTRSITTLKALQATRNTSDWDNWDIASEGTQLGYVSMKVNQEQLIYNSGQNKTFFKKQAYQIGDLDFYFKIDSIYRSYSNKKTNYNYAISFGEGKGGKAIKWMTAKDPYLKTTNGRIYVNRGLERFQHENWKHNYYVGLGLGQPLRDSIKNTFVSVDMVNIIAIASALE